MTTAGNRRLQTGLVDERTRSRNVIERRRAPRPGAWTDYTAYYAAGNHTVVGTLKVLPQVWSPQLKNARDILVYLPPSYTESARRYPVIYMHDGQNLFDDATSFSCEWAVDETLETASRTGMEAIVVGIPNMGAERSDEYSPFVDARNGGGRGDAYLAFIVETLKPVIDHDFRTQPEREHTGIFGSSMGGLISLYAIFRHPATFGMAGVMSPALWFARRAIFEVVERAAELPGKIYLDVGTGEGASTLADVRRMQKLLRQRAHRTPHRLCYVEEAGAGHCEAAWAGRLRGALRFLLHDICRQTVTPT